MKTPPPKWLTGFLRWYCHKDLLSAIEGDLYELYQRRISKYNRTTANLMYFINVLMFLQPFAMKGRDRTSRINTIEMVRNNFKIAYRSLNKTRLVTAINIFGLAMGIACFIMMMTYVIQEISYDRFHSKADRIYRLTYSYKARDKKSTIAKVAFPLKYRILENYPQVEHVVRFFENRMDATTLKYGDKLFTEKKVFFTDPEVFEVFDFRLIAGNPSTALSQKNSIILTERMANKYFGDENPIGKTLLYKNQDRLEVTGIVDSDFKSHIDFNFLVPIELQRQRWMGEASNNGYDFEKDWKWSGSWSYILLKDEGLIEDFSRTFFEDGLDLFDRVENPTVDFHFSTQPLLDIHLKSDLVAEIGSTGNQNQVYGFSIIAILILLIASINYINLSTAQSANRAKEIGLRKVMGAVRTNIIGQFITESILVTIISSFIGMIILELMVPVFNSFMITNISIPYVQYPVLIGLIILGAIVLGLLAGTYPSLYLSKFNPIRTLRGNYDASSNAGLRKFLVTVQFVVANILIAGILVIQLQMNFVRDKNLGFDKEQVIILTHGSKIDDEYQQFSSRLLSNPRITATNLGYVAGDRSGTQSFRIDGKDMQDAKSLGFKHINYGFVDMFDLEVVAGRNFSRQFSTDSTKAILLNESAVKTFGWTNEEALGHTFSWIGGTDNKTRFETKVVGVLKDANFESLYEPVKPSVFKFNSWGDISIKFNTDSHEELLSTVEFAESVWKEFAPNWPFEFTFLDQQIQDQYQKEEKLGQMIQFFAVVAVLIACMGLFGLATFTVQKKTKEIGVRKVLGARVSDIVLIVSKGFMVLIVVSFLVSFPIGFILAREWLQDFAYQINLNPLLFVLSGIISLVVALLAVSTQSVHAARLNPVNTLRYE